MTIASKLLYGRRSSGDDRRSSAALAGDAPPRRRSADAQHHRPSSPLRSNAARNHHQHRCDQLRSKRVIGDFGAGDCVTRRVNATVVGHELDRHLPNSVLQARARLLERLRDLHPAESRKQIIVRRASLLEHRHTEEMNLCKTETEPQLPLSDSSFFTLHSNQINQKLPPVFGDCPHRFHEETFTCMTGTDESSKASTECSICLEGFSDGAKVICLPCGHRYHGSCIQPWVQAHGLCPYCRAIITR